MMNTLCGRYFLLVCSVQLWLSDGLCRNNKHDQAAVKTGGLAWTARRSCFQQPSSSDAPCRREEGHFGGKGLLSPKKS